MTDACCSTSPTPPPAPGASGQPKAPVCPTNQRVGRRVDVLTLKALLARPLTELAATDYGFCRAPDCPTVYFSLDGAQLFGESDLREKVYQKHPTEDDVLVCYCFQHSLAGIRAEWQETHTSTVVESITAGIQADKCACEIRNPQGNCCLGNVVSLVNKLRMGN